MNRFTRILRSSVPTSVRSESPKGSLPLWTGRVLPKQTLSQRRNMTVNLKENPLPLNGGRLLLRNTLRLPDCFPIIRVCGLTGSGGRLVRKQFMRRKSTVPRTAEARESHLHMEKTAFCIRLVWSISTTKKRFMNCWRGLRTNSVPKAVNIVWLLRLAAADGSSVMRASDDKYRYEINFKNTKFSRNDVEDAIYNAEINRSDSYDKKGYTLNGFAENNQHSIIEDICEQLGVEYTRWKKN